MSALQSYKHWDTFRSRAHALSRVQQRLVLQLGDGACARCKIWGALQNLGCTADSRVTLGCTAETSWSSQCCKGNSCRVIISLHVITTFIKLMHTQLHEALHVIATFMTLMHTQLHGAILRTIHYVLGVTPHYPVWFASPFCQELFVQ